MMTSIAVFLENIFIGILNLLWADGIAMAVCIVMLLLIKTDCAIRKKKFPERVYHSIMPIMVTLALVFFIMSFFGYGIPYK